MATDKKRELVDFLVKKAFNPVLHTRADGRSEAEKQKLEHVRDATQAEIERYRDTRAKAKQRSPS
jgi:hypothetical protein